MNDLALLNRFVEHRDPEAFRELVDRYQQVVYGVCCREMSSSADAQDITQDVFLALARHAGTIKRNLGGWLFVCARNQSRSRMRSDVARRRRERARPPREFVEDDRVQWLEVREALDLCLEQLDHDEREILVLRYYAGWTQVAIAGELGVSDSEVHRRLKRATGSLRALLERRGFCIGAAALVGGLGGVAGASDVPASLTAELNKIGLSGLSVGSAGVTTGLVAWGGTKVVGAGVVLVLGLVVAGVLAVRPGASAAPGAGMVEVPAETAATEDWRARFDRIYRLEEGEVLRRVAPPFIAERLEYYRAEDPHQFEAIAEPPDYFTFVWEGGERRPEGFGFVGGRHTLDGVLRHSLGLESYLYEGEERFLDQPLPGDWLVRARDEDGGGDTAKFLRALEGIMREDPELIPVRFVAEKVIRDVIVVRGQYAFTPIPGVRDNDRVHLYADSVDPDESFGGGSGTLDEFLKSAGSKLGLRAVNEAECGDETGVKWYYNRDSYGQRMEGNERGRIAKVLGNLAAQTTLTFTVEPREVGVWRVEAAP